MAFSTSGRSDVTTGASEWQRETRRHGRQGSQREGTGRYRRQVGGTRGSGEASDRNERESERELETTGGDGRQQMATGDRTAQGVDGSRT